MKRKEGISPGNKNLPEGYADLINGLKVKIRSAQVKAVLLCQP